MSAGTLDVTLHIILSPDSDSQSRASVSQGEKNCSAPQSLFTWEAMSEVCALHPKSLEANGLAVADTISPGKSCPLSQGSKEQGKG